MSIIGRRVKSVRDLYENDWWNAPWDGDDDPVCVPDDTEGTIMSIDDLPGFVFVKFDTGIEWSCSLWGFDGIDDGDVQFLRFLPSDRRWMEWDTWNIANEG